jgi:HSP20 family protein
MHVVRWDPFAEMENLLHRSLPRSMRFAAGSDAARLEWSPSADISETDKEYLIRAELPAVKKEDVKVTVDAGTITIEGERRQKQEDTNEKYHRVESVYGSFMRQFSLPENTDAGTIRCESQDGVLTVHIPKKVQEKAKPIQVKVQ